MRQDFESSLPAEFTQPVREVDEDGFHNPEMRAKRARAEREERERYRGGMDPYQAYQYQQLQAAEQGYQIGPDGEYYYTGGGSDGQQEGAEGNTGGIVSQEALQTLARLAGTMGARPKADGGAKNESTKKITGLVLADYGSSDEEEEESGGNSADAKD